MNWIEITDLKLVPQVTPVMVFAMESDNEYNVAYAELEGKEWWERGSFEVLEFTPTHYATVELPIIVNEVNYSIPQKFILSQLERDRFKITQASLLISSQLSLEQMFSLITFEPKSN